MNITQFEKILIVGPAWVGDMVMSQVLFKYLKLLHPQVVIDVLAPVWTHSLLSFMPEVNQGLASPFAHGELRLRERRQLGIKLRDSDYTRAIVIPNSIKSALVPYWAKIPVRTGWLGEMRYRLLNDSRSLDKVAMPLMIQRLVALALPKSANIPQKLPKPSLIVREAEWDKALRAQELSLSGRPILGLCSGAEFGASKRWLPEHFATLALNRLDEGWDVWLFGSEKDLVAAETIQTITKQRCINLVGRTTLSEAVILMSRLSAVVTNDSGLMHVAAALGIPLVAIYGSSSATFTPPLTKNAEIVNLNLECSPCYQRECPLQHHRCMKDLSPEQVLQALDRLMINAVVD